MQKMGLLSALMSIFLFRFLVSEAHDGEGGLGVVSSIWLGQTLTRLLPSASRGITVRSVFILCVNLLEICAYHT